ncbi:prepilin-type N-terminal cleavage/methylation domain-containing protein [Pseudohalioglobus sediminis]|uniref:Type II secretion system protein H n=1 Tax=Pseudohalioglobus sediminis TaxID=2606449 RepID=A0A5B0WQ26_9GAMM|nr:GspH/FimT family pseudopilin [Pseudohalioglobus sediminis]KAA1188345.1 prepilin-type N-terminal cleavage/methylation domain-containing protein [Pseudohalioglobus sediminis]
MSDKRTGRQAAGFSLLELIVVVSIVVVTATFAVPGFSYLLESTRIRTAAVRLMHDIVLARSEAIKRNRQVVLCPTDHAQGAAPVCGGVLAAGWLVFEDSDFDGTLDDGEAVLHAGSGLPDQLSLTNRSARKVVVQPLRFRPDGSSPGNKTLMVCSRVEPRATSWSVVMNLVGRPRLARDWGVCPAGAG